MRSDVGQIHNVSPEGRRKMRRASRTTLREQKGIHDPAYRASDEAHKAWQQGGLKSSELGVGVHSPAYIARRQAIGQAAYESGTGIHAATDEQRRVWASMSKSHPLFFRYGVHLRWHINNIRMPGSAYCIFCDNPKSLPAWFFEKLKAEFQGGAL
jgi:hypothetical protein